MNPDPVIPDRDMLLAREIQKHHVEPWAGGEVSDEQNISDIATLIYVHTEGAIAEYLDRHPFTEPGPAAQGPITPSEDELRQAWRRIVALQKRIAALEAMKKENQNLRGLIERVRFGLDVALTALQAEIIQTPKHQAVLREVELSINEIDSLPTEVDA